jgi:hypothetical protein
VGEKAEMNAHQKIPGAIAFWTLVLTFAAVSFSCAEKKPQPAPPPPPTSTIEVEEHETNKNISLTVRYVNHFQDYTVFVKLDSLAKLRAYKKEVEFLLQRIEQVEERMNVHEDKPKTGLFGASNTP